MRFFKLAIVLMIVSPLLSYAYEPVKKRSLKSNMMEVFYDNEGRAFDLTGLFDNGIFYGRLRFNTFTYDVEKEIEGIRKDYYTMGAGGSLLYQSAYFYGFGFFTGLYTTQNPLHMDDSDVIYYRAGKGVLSRYNVLTQGDHGITALAQGYITYKNYETSFRLGRQIFESFLTKSNDTKMIPNTFEGITLHTSYFKDTAFKAAYLTRQKLRDHKDFHHLLRYGDNPDDPYAKWSENDDSAMHRGLIESALKAHNIEDKLLIIEMTNYSFKDTALTMNYTAVPDLISSAMVQLRRTFRVGDFKIIPAIRYMHQFDDGAGEIAGANLKTNTYGYKDPKSLESALYGARIDIAQHAWKLRFGFTQIADEGDILAPWRGFPTAGFTRSMAQYNWYANTKTFMLRADYDFTKEKLIPGLKAMIRYAVQDFDDSKSGVQADSDVFTLDLLKQFADYPNFYTKFRMAYVDGKGDTVSGDGMLKSDPAYHEFRFELNYLF